MTMAELCGTYKSDRALLNRESNVGKWTMRICNFMVDHLGELVLVSACFSKEELAAQAAHWGEVPVFLNLHFFGSSSLMTEIYIYIYV